DRGLTAVLHRFNLGIRAAVAALILATCCGASTVTGPMAGYRDRLGSEVPFYAVVPFYGLACVAVLLIAFLPHWWSKLRNQLLVVAAVSLPVSIALLVEFKSAAGEALFEAGEDYIVLMSYLLACTSIGRLL